MIDLTASLTAAPVLHVVSSGPGFAWTRDADVAIEAPPDNDSCPLPESRWSKAAKLTGICCVVSPRGLMLPNGGCRMYYPQMLPRPGFTAGANDYDDRTTRILSAYSKDGQE